MATQFKRVAAVCDDIRTVLCSVGNAGEPLAARHAAATRVRTLFKDGDPDVAKMRARALETNPDRMVRVFPCVDFVHSRSKRAAIATARPSLIC